MNHFKTKQNNIATKFVPPVPVLLLSPADLSLGIPPANRPPSPPEGAPIEPLPPPPPMLPPLELGLTKRKSHNYVVFWCQLEACKVNHAFSCEMGQPMVPSIDYRTNNYCAIPTNVFPLEQYKVLIISGFNASKLNFISLLHTCSYRWCTAIICLSFLKPCALMNLTQ